MPKSEMEEAWVEAHQTQALREIGKMIDTQVVPQHDRWVWNIEKQDWIYVS